MAQVYRGGSGRRRSAGSRPADRVHTEVVQVLAEIGIDVSENVPHLLDRATWLGPTWS